MFVFRWRKIYTLTYLIKYNLAKESLLITFFTNVGIFFPRHLPFKPMPILRRVSTNGEMSLFIYPITITHNYPRDFAQGSYRVHVCTRSLNFSLVRRQHSWNLFRLFYKSRKQKEEKKKKKLFIINSFRISRKFPSWICKILRIIKFWGSCSKLLTWWLLHS